MNHKITLWPSIAAVVIVWMFLDAPKNILPPLDNRLLIPGSGIPGFPSQPPVLPQPPAKSEVLARND